MSTKKRTKLTEEQARQDQAEQERDIVEDELVNGRVAKETMKEGSKGSKPDWFGDKDKGPNGEGSGKGESKSETRYCCDCGEQGHIGVNCLYLCADMITDSTWCRFFELSFFVSFTGSVFRILFRKRIFVNIPHRWSKWTNSIDDQGSSWESEREVEKPEELASLEAG